MTSPSSENSVRRLAEKIAWGYMMSWPPDREQKPLFLGPTQYISMLESLLSEAMDQGYNRAVAIALGKVDEIRKEARSAAYRDAAEIAEDHAKIKGAHIHEGFQYCVEVIADKLRRKASEYSQ